MRDCLAIGQVVTFQLLVMVLVEEGYGKNTKEWAGKAERQWKQRTTQGRKTNKEKVRKEPHRVKPLMFQSRR